MQDKIWGWPGSEARTCLVASFLGAPTGSDGKLSRAWEQGYMSCQVLCIHRSGDVLRFVNRQSVSVVESFEETINVTVSLCSL